MSLPQRLADCLCERQPADKVACVHALQADWLAGRVAADTDAARAPIDHPATRPTRTDSAAAGATPPCDTLPAAPR